MGIGLSIAAGLVAGAVFFAGGRSRIGESVPTQPAVVEEQFKVVGGAGVEGAPDSGRLPELKQHQINVVEGGLRHALSDEEERREFEAFAKKVIGPDGKINVSDERSAEKTTKGWYTKYPSAEIWRGFDYDQRIVLERTCMDNGVNPVPLMKYCQDCKGDPFLVLALIKAESAFVRNAKSRAGARGFMQVMEPTAKEMWRRMGFPVEKLDLNNPDHNLRVGIRYLAHIQNDYDWVREIKDYCERAKIVLACYNWGVGNVENNGGEKGVFDMLSNVPKETKDYVERVSRHYEEYMREVVYARMLIEKEAAEEAGKSGGDKQDGSGKRYAKQESGK
ncbi:MAG TPA: lytic transglycosylase domain-containing protein [Candidatus Altiarchaeales archaeon]|nr:lytic transglycosylase domain-containing protein [Candidatus Altiarchaeales archaeon]